MESLKVLVIASSAEMQQLLEEQLMTLDFVQAKGIFTELSEGVSLCQKQMPDVIVIELTDRELDGGLFIQAINMNIDNPSVIVALHRRLEQNVMFEAFRQGAKEFIHYPNEAEKLEAALRRQNAILHRAKKQTLVPEEVQKGKVISVFSPKGGTGSTTLSVNLAHELYQITKQPVITIDLDFSFNNTAVILNLKPSYALGDLTTNRGAELDESLIQRIICPHESGMELIVATKNAVDENDMLPKESFEKILAYLVSNYRYIIIDLPSRTLDPLHEFMVQICDMLLLVSTADIPALYRSKQYLDLVKQHFNEDKIKLIINRKNIKAAFGMTNEALEAEFQHPVFERITDDWDLNLQANSLGCVLSKANANAGIVKDIQRLASTIAGAEIVKKEDKKEAKGNILGRLFGGLNTPQKGGELGAIRKA